MKSPAALRTELEGILTRRVLNEWGGEVPKDFRADVAPSDNLDFGDISCSSAMALARPLRCSPRRIAETMSRGLERELDWISRVSVDGPGFINFTLSTGHLTRTAFQLARGLHNLLPDQGGGRTALVEFVSSNPTGPLTVGHCRQAVLGDAISSLLEAVGWNVSREYYFNDGGRQMKLLGQSLAARYGDPGTEIPGDGYRGDYMEGWAERLREVRGEGLRWKDDPDVFVDFAREMAMDRIKRDLALLKVDFDSYFPESRLIPEAVEQTIDSLEDLRPKGRSLICRDEEEPEKLWLRLTDLDRPRDRVVRRGDGSYTYRMPDIAYHLDKFQRGYDLIVDVFGSDHLDTSRDVTAALEALLGKEKVSGRLRVVLHQFVTLLKDGTRIKMSTRAGEFITLQELIEDVGSVDVTRYLFLTRRAEAHMDFDLDLAREQSGENPVFYVQYAFARIAGILRKAKKMGIAPPEEPLEEVLQLLTGEHERELMRLLESIPSRVCDAAAALEPHRLTELMAETATGFHSFYQHVRVVDPEAPQLSAARLTLCRACAAAISGLLGILGADAPERM